MQMARLVQSRFQEKHDHDHDQIQRHCDSCQLRLSSRRRRRHRDREARDSTMKCKSHHHHRIALSSPFAMFLFMMVTFHIQGFSSPMLAYAGTIIHTSDLKREEQQQQSGSGTGAGDAHHVNNNNQKCSWGVCNEDNTHAGGGGADHHGHGHHHHHGHGTGVGDTTNHSENQHIVDTETPPSEKIHYHHSKAENSSSSSSPSPHIPFVKPTTASATAKTAAGSSTTGSSSTTTSATSGSSSSSSTAKGTQGSSSSTSGTTASSTTSGTGMAASPQKIHKKPKTVDISDIEPPEGFVITTRVYTDPNDKLAHFDNDVQDSISLPYWECGALGLTTQPLSINNAYFRYALSGSYPTIWSGAEYGPHPQLIITLSEVEIVLNSGESAIFSPGKVILVEDVVSSGHKVISTGKHDMTYLLLTLPQHYHHTGKDHKSLKSSHHGSSKNHPCPVTGMHSTTTQDQSAHMHHHSKSSSKGAAGNNRKQQQSFFGFGANNNNKSNKNPFLSTTTTSYVDYENNRIARALGENVDMDQVRKLLFAGTGMAIFTAFADFLGKVAPLWLAVGIGATFLVGTGTYGFVQLSEYIYDTIQTKRERNRLMLGSMHDDDDDDIDDDIDINVDDLNMDKMDLELDQVDLQQDSSGGKTTTTTTTTTQPVATMESKEGTR